MAGGGRRRRLAAGAGARGGGGGGPRHGRKRRGRPRGGACGGGGGGGGGWGGARGRGGWVRCARFTGKIGARHQLRGQGRGGGGLSGLWRGGKRLVGRRTRGYRGKGEEGEGDCSGRALSSGAPERDRWGGTNATARIARLELLRGCLGHRRCWRGFYGDEQLPNSRAFAYHFWIADARVQPSAY